MTGTDVDVVDVLGHGGSVVLGGGIVVPPGIVVGTKVLVVVGQGPTPPPGRGQSKWTVVVVVEDPAAVVGVCPPTQPNRASHGSNVWRTIWLLPKLSSTPRSASQILAWNVVPATGTDCAPTDVCICMTPAARATTSAARRSDREGQGSCRRNSEPPTPPVRMVPPSRLAVWSETLYPNGGRTSRLASIHRLNFGATI